MGWAMECKQHKVERANTSGTENEGTNGRLVSGKGREPGREGGGGGQPKPSTCKNSVRKLATLKAP